MIDDRADLSNAIALNSSNFNPHGWWAPPLPAPWSRRSAKGYCFLIDGLSYIAVIAGLLACGWPPPSARGRTGACGTS